MSRAMCQRRPAANPTLRAASQAQVDALYATHAPDQLRQLARREHAPLQELIRLLA